MAVVAIAKKLFSSDDNTAESTAAAAVTASAWAPAAALVSLATFGANMGPALEALGVTLALSEAFAGLSSLGKHKDGGWINGAGTGTSDSNLRWLSNGEFVVNAQSASQNGPALEAINAGRTVQGGTSSSRPISVSDAAVSKVPLSMQMHVEVHNNSGMSVQTMQISENRIRVIVGEEAPGVIANHIQNPNSSVSKAIKRNVTPERVR